jgi:hypothetical protein
MINHLSTTVVIVVMIPLTFQCLFFDALVNKGDGYSALTYSTKFKQKSYFCNTHLLNALYENIQWNIAPSSSLNPPGPEKIPLPHSG